MHTAKNAGGGGVDGWMDRWECGSEDAFGRRITLLGGSEWVRGREYEWMDVWIDRIGSGGLG